MRALFAWICCAWLFAALCALGCRYRSGACEPAGEPVLAAPAIGALALDKAALYYSSLAAGRATGNLALPEVWRVSRTGGTPQLLYRGSVPQALPFDTLDVDPFHAYFLEPCGAPEPAECASLRRVPITGGQAETIIRDRVAAFDLAADTIYYAISDERGLQQGEPDGAVFAVPKHLGVAPAALVTGLTRLREVIAGEHALYLSITTGVRAGNAAPRAIIARLPLPVERPVDIPIDLPLGAGSNLETAVELPGVGGARPSAIVLAGNALILYHPLEGWLRVPLDRGEPELLARPQNPIMDAAYAAGTVYGVDPGRFKGTTDESQGTYLCGAIWAVAAAGGRPSRFAAEQRQPRVIIADDTEVYWASDDLAEAADRVRRLPAGR